MLKFITPFSYWVLTALWLSILVLYLSRLRGSKVLGGTVSILVTLLAIDAFRTLFESVYFGFYFNSMFGLLPGWIYDTLSHPGLIIIPKLVNIIAGILVLTLLVRRWLPREAEARKALAKSLEESSFLAVRRQAEFQAIFNSITDAIIFVDPERRILMINPAFTSTFGYNIEELSGQTTQLIYADPELYRKMGRVRFNKDSEPREDDHVFLNEYRRKDGTLFTGETLGSRVVDKNGQFLGFVGVIRDISERLQTRQELTEKIAALQASKQALAESEQRFRALLEASYSGIIIHQDGIIQDCNSGLSDIIGFSRDELIGKYAYDLMTPDSRQEAEYLVHSGAEHRYEVMGIRKDGSVFPLAIKGRNISINGEKARVIELRDISEEIELKEAQIKLNEELRTKVKELEEVVYVASHDLRSPLVTIEGFSGVLKESLNEITASLEKEDLSPQTKSWLAPFLEDGQKAISYIQTSAQNMSSLLRGLLQASRMSRVEISKEPIDMNVLMARILAGFKYQMEQRGAKISVGQLPNCKGDQEQLSQVFRNLIDNAMKYAHPDRPCIIDVSGKTSGNRSIYCVEDNGQGIALKYQERIFDLFNQVDKEAEGEGLGLSIVRKIVERHDGEIRLESDVDRGSRFCITL